MRPARYTTRMTKRLYLCTALLLSALIAACGPVADVIGDREAPTPTSRVFSTATPGGKLSVWLITPTGQYVQPATPTPGGVGNPVGPNATATAAIATIQAATLTAAAPPPAPYFQPTNARYGCATPTAAPVGL